MEQVRMQKEEQKQRGISLVDDFEYTVYDDFV